MKFLIVRFGAIGDCIMAVPVADSVKQHDPNAEIWWTVEQPCGELLDSNLINRVYPVPRVKKNRLGPDAWRRRILAYHRLRQENFDYGLDLQGHLKTALCLKLAAPKKRLMVRTSDKFTALLNPLADSPETPIHIVDTYMHALAQLGPFNTEAHWVMPALSREKAAVMSLIEEKPLVTISVGGSAKTKRYPVELLVSVADQLIESGYQVAWVGGKDDELPPLRFPLNFIGRLSLKESAALIQLSHVVITNDTWSSHAAAAFKTPVVALFGPTDWRLAHPYSESYRVVFRGPDIAAIASEDILARFHELMPATPRSAVRSEVWRVES